MYESFFSFQGRPFSAAPNTKLYFPAMAIEQARQTLTQSIERGDGAAIVIGPSGTGKSLLMHLLAQQHRDQFEVVLLTSARLCTRRALLQNILFELKLPYRDMEEGELRLSMIDHLDPANSRGMLLLVDEAHTLPARLLEEIRMITNLVREGGPCVRLVLAGTRALEERLAHPKLESLNQRVASRSYLESMCKEDTRDMVRRQVVAVGGNPDAIFAEGAIDAIHRAADGIPRLVNQVADHTLLLACIGEQEQITEAAVNEAWADIQQLPTPWNTQAPAAPENNDSVIEFGSLDEEASFGEEVFQEAGEDNESSEGGVELATLDDFAESHSVVSDSLESGDIETLAGAATDNAERAATENEQVELRLAPFSLHEKTAGGSATEDEEKFPSVAIDDVVTLELASDDPPAIEVSSKPVAPQVEISTSTTETVKKLEFVDSGFLATTIASEQSRDDPFDEHFEDEEVVIEVTSKETRGVVVPQGPLSKEFSRLIGAEIRPESEPAEILTWSTAEPQTVLEPIITITGIEAFDGSLGEAIVLADNTVDTHAALEDNHGVDHRQAEVGDSEDGVFLEVEQLPTESTDVEPVADEVDRQPQLSDNAEWEPTFGAISTADDALRVASDELEIDVALSDGDLIDESIVAVDDEELIVIDDEVTVAAAASQPPKANATIKDYRQLFAQLRRG